MKFANLKGYLLAAGAAAAYGTIRRLPSRFTTRG